MLGVTAYKPLANPENVYEPELLAVVVTLAAPLNVTVAPDPPFEGLIVPEMPTPFVTNLWPPLFPLLFLESVDCTWK